MATLVFYEQFLEDLGNKVHDLSGDTINIVLSNTAPTVATDAALADATEIATGGGYTSGAGGGAALTDKQFTEASGVGTLTADATVITATSDSIGPFQYYILRNTSADKLICYWDHGSAVTLADTETFTITFGADATDGTIFTIGSA